MCAVSDDVIVIIPNLILYSNSLLIPLDNYRRVFLFLFLQIVPVCVCVCGVRVGRRESREIYSGSSLFVSLKLSDHVFLAMSTELN